MIYDYHCIDCGERFEGREICFDLAELLGIRQDENESTFAVRSTLVDFERLNEFAQHSAGVRGELKHGKKTVITVTLREFLELMAENEGDKGLLREIGEKTYGDIKEILGNLYTGLSAGEEKDMDVESFITAIKAHFICTDDKPEKEEERYLDAYEAVFCVQPEFFAEGASDEVYTIKYHYDINAVNLKSIGMHGLVRGYCPKCGKVIVSGAGKYRHTLVGLLGVQKAGKTSTIVAILEELRTNFAKLGIIYPGNPLWDSRSAARDLNIRLYRKGWAMEKTPVATNSGSFNATLLIEANHSDRSDDQKKQIVTFVDIAGEQCYDREENTVNKEALQVYPLINSCDVFLLCTGIAPDENDRENEQDIPPQAVLEISKYIYQSENKFFRTPENVPPVCIVATKSDLATGAEAARETRDNPFVGVQVGPEYQYESEIRNLRDLYEATTDEEVRNALDICLSAYELLSKQTYVSMMSCWALGRSAEKLPEDMDKGNIQPYRDPESGSVRPFKRMRIDRLCKWIFQVTGILEIDGYSFPHIPSYGEGYCVDGLETWGIRKKYHVDEAIGRIGAVRKVFINCPDTEENIRAELQYFEDNPRMWHREKKREKVVRELLGR